MGEQSFYKEYNFLGFLFPSTHWMDVFKKKKKKKQVPLGAFFLLEFNRTSSTVRRLESIAFLQVDLYPLS